MLDMSDIVLQAFHDPPRWRVSDTFPLAMSLYMNDTSADIFNVTYPSVLGNKLTTREWLRGIIRSVTSLIRNQWTA